MLSSNAVDMSNNMINLCRICSAPGSHSIFAKIPPYLHEHPRECAQWTMPIHRLVTEVSGLEITVDDGLPQKICVVCISYLKHAYTFRRQTINNVAALLAAKYLLMAQEERKDAKYCEDTEIIPTLINPAVIPPNMNNLSYNTMTTKGSRRDRKSMAYQKNIGKEVLFQLLGDSGQNNKKQNNAEEERRRIAEAFSNGWQECSPEDFETGNASEFFSYTEKEFQEDDVMELDVLRENNISFNLPEDYKEKKCISCRKRFMFDESYNSHLKECLLFKLVKFIREVYNFLFLKENRSISSFEFIRRMVFSVKQMVEVISNYGEESTESESDIAATYNDQGATDERSRIESSFLTNLEKLRIDYNTEDALTSSTLEQQSDDGRSNFTTESTSISSLVTVTRCDECFATFESAADLESHNSSYHRKSIVTAATTPNNLKSLTGFPPPPMSVSPKEMDMIKNRFRPGLLESTNRGIQPGGESDDQFKKVSCKKCEKRFFTISELDHHRIRSCQWKSNSQLPLQSPAERSKKNLNASYFHTMELLKNMK